MIRQNARIFSMALLLFCPTLQAADTKPAAPTKTIPPGVKLLPNIEYASVNGKSLLLDLYLPDTSGKPLPVIMFVHGGGWVAGSKSDYKPIFLTEFGYAVASINYRFSQEAPFPAQIQDCKAAVRWLRAHARFYNLDRSRIGVWGTSAGGHLVALLGTSGDVKELEGDEGNLDQSSRVQAVCDWYGPTDFLKIDEEAAQSALGDHRMNANSPDSLVSKLIGGPIQKNKDKVALANPLTFVSKDDPPFLIIHGDKDSTVPLAQSEILRDALQKAGVEVKLIVLPGAIHGDPQFRTPETFQKVLDFFDAHLKIPGAGK